MVRKRIQRWWRAAEDVRSIETRQVVSGADDGRTTRLWKHHWVRIDSARQVILFATRRLNIDRPLDEQMPFLREIRLSRWDAKKPLSYKGETRWVHKPSPRRGYWTSWGLVHEAGHQTHTAGTDLDISYVTTANQKHFHGSWKAMDVPRTWQWFELLSDAARKSGQAVERILVGPRIYRLLKRRLPKRLTRSGKFRSLIRQVEGHDAHHHLRLRPSTDQPVATIPWLWRVDERLSRLFREALSGPEEPPM